MRFLDEILGPPLCRIYERSATGPLPPNAPPPASPGLFVLRAAKVLGWWWHGLGRPNPFFDDRTGTPLSAPRFVTRASARLFEWPNGHSRLVPTFSVVPFAQSAFHQPWKLMGK